MGTRGARSPRGGGGHQLPLPDAGASPELRQPQARPPARRETRHPRRLGRRVPGGPEQPPGSRGLGRLLGLVPSTPSRAKDVLCRLHQVEDGRPLTDDDPFHRTCRLVSTAAHSCSRSPSARPWPPSWPRRCERFSPWRPHAGWSYLLQPDSPRVRVAPCSTAAPGGRGPGPPERGWPGLRIAPRPASRTPRPARTAPCTPSELRQASACPQAVFEATCGEPQAESSTRSARRFGDGHARMQTILSESIGIVLTAHGWVCTLRLGHRRWRVQPRK